MEPFSGIRYAGEDWYARELGADRYESCTFVDCDFTELSTTGTVFDRCEFLGVAMNASVHETTRFDNCTFRDGSLFGAALTNCKLTGTRFIGTALRPLTISGGVWTWVSFFGADLRGVNFDGLNLEESDFGEARLDTASFRESNLTRVSLRGASVVGANFVGATLAGVQLGGLSWSKTRIDGQLAIQIAESLGAVVVA